MSLNDTTDYEKGFLSLYSLLFCFPLSHTLQGVIVKPPDNKKQENQCFCFLNLYQFDFFLILNDQTLKNTLQPKLLAVFIK